MLGESSRTVSVEIPERWRESDLLREIKYAPRRTDSNGRDFAGTPRLAVIIGLFSSTHKELEYATNRIKVESAFRDDNRFSEEYELFLFRGNEKPKSSDLENPGDWYFVN